MSPEDNFNQAQEIESEVLSENPVTSAGSEKEAQQVEGAAIENLVGDMQSLPAVAEEKVIQGTVLKVTETEVTVEVGLKCEGAIPLQEFRRDDGSLTVSPGDTVAVLIEHYNEKEGPVTLSHQKAQRLKIWEEIEAAFREKRKLTGRVVDRTKGGLIVDIGVRAFLPGSLAHIRSVGNLDSLKGKEITCQVIKLNRERRNVVVSRKAAVEEKEAAKKNALLESLVEGAVLSGRVKNITDYGVFVNLGSVDGLLHITDLSWGKVRHPSEVVELNQEVQVKVLRYDREKGRVSLGLKQLSEDPWLSLPEKYQPNSRVRGRVVSLTDYGAFIELEPGVEGLVHISEMSWGKRLKHPSKIVHLNDTVDVVILDVKPAERRICLGLKQTLPDPWLTLAERYSVGSVVQGRVRNLTSFGAFVEIEEGVDGLIHLSDLSWTKRPKHPSEVLKKGQKIEAVILGLDAPNRRLSLGLKQLQPDTWESFFSRTQVGDRVRGKISRIASFGAFVELAEGLEGLCHISEVGEEHKGSARGRLEVGSEFDFRVIKLNPAEKKIGLSLKEVQQKVPPGRAAVGRGNGEQPREAAVMEMKSSAVLPESAQ